jgi:hypothetical protein
MRGINMKRIKLTQGKQAIVDNNDYGKISTFKWNVAEQKCTSYASRAIKVNGKWTTQYMHRLIMDAPVGMDVDHINRNGIDNRKENMRICTRSQNLQWKRPTGASGYKGVYWCKNKKKWRVQIKVDDKRMSLGSYSNKIDAAKAYDTAAKIAHGEFAYINIPKEAD